MRSADISYYVIKGDGNHREIVVRRGRPNDCRSLVQGMNQVRCRQCWTYEHLPPSPDNIIPTMIYTAASKTITIPHICLHSFGIIAAVLNKVIQDNYAADALDEVHLEDMESLIDVHVKQLNFQDCCRIINAEEVGKVFAGVNLHFDVTVTPGELPLRDFMKFIQLFNYNFKTIKLLVPLDSVAGETYGHGFTMEEYGKFVTVPILTPWLLQQLTLNLALEELHVGSFGELNMLKFNKTIHPHCRLKVLTIEDVSRELELTDEQINGIVKICLAFKKTLVELVIGDVDAIHIISNIFGANHVWPLLRNIAIYCDKQYPDVAIAPTNRFNFPVLTSVYFAGTDVVYEANPPIINQLTMEAYPARYGDLYLFLVRNRRNFMAARVWELIAEKHLPRAYRISPDIRRLISHMITHIDTRKLRFVEPAISTKWRDVLSVERISATADLPREVLYCVDEVSMRQWTKINKVRLTAEKHQERRKKLAIEIGGLEAELAEDPRAKIHRIRKSIEKKRKRIDALQVYKDKLESKLKKLKK